MPLQLRSGCPVPIPVPLGGGAVAMVRPASSFESDLAIAGAAAALAGLIESQEAAQQVAELLGLDFEGADFTSRRFLDAAAERLSLLELATLCIVSWSGLIDDNRVAIEHPDRGSIALLLRDIDVSHRVSAAISGRVNLEIVEKKDSDTSQTGVAAGEISTAPTAENPT